MDNCGFIHWIFEVFHICCFKIQPEIAGKAVFLNFADSNRMAEGDKPVSSTRTQGNARTGRGKKQGEDMSSFFFGRVLPQAVPLEEAVLGAIMLDKDALTVVIDILRPDSFYREEHQQIYRAMIRLFERSNPIDSLTVMEELRKMGELEAVGGPAYLANLTLKVASAANLEYHARIVSQKFIQRELIRTSTRTIKDAFEDTTDVFELLDDAEQGLFGIAEQNMSRSFDTISSLAGKALKQIEELKNKTDRLTSGLQRSDLVILAARPGMGKTAFVLSLAKNSASQFSKGVAIFSLEMSSLQLAQRIIAMEAEISGSKMRNGQLEEYEWQQLHSAIERVGEAPIYIDDTPGINVFELRAKCRRLKMQYDIQLIIIDYLQLMSGGGDNQRGNREQEVSAISRSLKSLAKELNVPVIALSQLSRAVEVRGGSKRPQLSDLRESGCLTGDTLLQNAETGERITIQSLAEREDQIPIKVFAVDSRYKVAGHPMVKAFYSGRKPVFELITRTGRRIKASANHPFLKLEGWAPLDQLKIGDRIGVPRALRPTKPANPISKDELILLAHLTGDGCILPKQPYHYTSADDANIEIVAAVANQLFEIEGRIVKQGNWHHVYLPSPYRLTHKTAHPITNWYEQLGIPRVRSFQKALPPAIFELDNDLIKIFLHHLWATDGNISWKRYKNASRSSSGAIYYATTSRELAYQVQHLLIRLAIKSTIRTINQGKYRPIYQVHIQGSGNQLKFLEDVGCYGQRGEIIPSLIETLKANVGNPNYDVIPKEFWNLYFKPFLIANGISQRSFAKLMDLQFSSAIFKNGISRNRMHKLAELFKEEKFHDLANSDVMWDEVIAIEPLGEQDVYDATVEGVHNFVANDIIVHNSIEQDADMVAFIYRPEYYQIMEDEEGQSLKGVAEVIVAKHRHGALKTIRLRFTDEFARFSDLDDPDFGNLPADTFDTYPSVITRSSKMNEDEDIPF